MHSWLSGLSSTFYHGCSPFSGGSVAAVKLVKGTGTPVIAPTKPLHFSGYDWQIRTIAGDRGGLNNLYDPDNAWTDASGAPHLRIRKKKAGGPAPRPYF